MAVSQNLAGGHPGQPGTEPDADRFTGSDDRALVVATVNGAGQVVGFVVEPSAFRTVPARVLASSALSAYVNARRAARASRDGDLNLERARRFPR